MKLSDRAFLCQNTRCASYQVAQDRDHNAALNILREALRLIGLLDQAVSGTGSDDDANEGLRRGRKTKNAPALRQVGMKQHQRKMQENSARIRLTTVIGAGRKHLRG